MPFTHLHVHSHYSILDGMSKVPDLVNKCLRTGMHAMALTDHGNMFGIKEFLDYSNNVNNKPKEQVKKCKDEIEKTANPIQKAELEAKLVELEKAAANYIPFKPIVGIETYCAHENFDDELLPGHQKHRGWHLILLAKNLNGYHNLCKLSSIAFTKGYYYNARIDYKLLEQYHEGLICCSACLGGEVPQKIMEGDIDGAEKSVRWFQQLFGDDYYLELQRHKTDKPNAATDVYEHQKIVNSALVTIARKNNIKLIATNDVHFVEEAHGEAHDRLICLSTQKDYDDPNRLHYTKQEWLKTPEEMAIIFADLPEALDNTQEIVDKVEMYSLRHDPIMPKFDIPPQFGTEEAYRQKITEQQLFEEFTQDEHGNVVLSPEEAQKKVERLGGYDRLYRIKLEADYLRKLTFEGAHKRYGDNLTNEQQERINFELHVMKTMGFPGYFLIVQDYIRAAREELSVSVGPGRGSAAGSVVAYCLNITDLDPFKYDLLFERFLNPDRISMPDIDVDFDDDGRSRVLEWVTQKYGYDRVAHIITYGVMAAKSAIADVGRVQKVPLATVNAIKKLIADHNLHHSYQTIPELQPYLQSENPNIRSMLQYAEELEDTNRQIGIHACGIIIGADDLTKFAPICTIDDKTSRQRVVVTQYDGHSIEDVGLIKMDFLGLKTLSLINEALLNIQKSHNQKIDINHIPLDDAQTYKLFCKGQTIGIFQFESAGMQKYLRELQPNCLEDLIAMNALYRPGPMDYIPSFIARKQGKEKISYDLPVMEKYLKSTYGITVYQEQVMLLSRLLANFTRGQSDALRKAMGKKKKDIVDAMKPKFIQGGQHNGHDPKTLKKIWGDWEKFASYAFNKSHAACYAWVAYQTAYLKAHYPAEYMAANLTRNKDIPTEVAKFMGECKALKINVKIPDVNESELNFTVNKNGEIRFGLGGIKGVGSSAVEAIVNERNAHGPYTDVFNFVERVNLNACNKKSFECLAAAGAFDSLGHITREQIAATNERGDQILDLLIRYGNDFQSSISQMQNSLFGDALSEISLARPKIPDIPTFSLIERLNKERDLIGIYLSSHPLDKFRMTIKYGCTNTLTDISEHITQKQPLNFIVGGMVTTVRSGFTKKNKAWGKLTLEDYNGQQDFFICDTTREQHYSRLQHLFVEGKFLLIQGRVQQRGWGEQPDTWDIEVQSMTELSEDATAVKKLIHKVQVSLYLENIDAITVNDLSAIIKDNKGDTPLYISVYDSDSGHTLPLYARNNRIQITQQLFDALDNLRDHKKLRYSINDRVIGGTLMTAETNTDTDADTDNGEPMLNTDLPDEND